MSSWFNSWQDFTAKASEVAKSATDKAVEAAKVAADKSKAAASSVHRKVNDFVEEQKKEYNEVEEESDLQRRRRLNKERMMRNGHSPWFVDRAVGDAATEDSDELEAELKLNILKLCENESTFLVKAPTSETVFGFKLDCALPYAQKALAEDPILPQIRFRAVPKKLSEEQFWRNYFYRVNVIRESLGVAKLNFSEPPRKASVQATEQVSEKAAKMKSKAKAKSAESIRTQAVDAKDKGKSKAKTKQDTTTGTDAEVKQEVDDDVDEDAALDEDVDVDALLAGEEEDEMSIHSMTDEEKAKKKRELGIEEITGSNDVATAEQDVEDLLAEVNTEDVDDMSDAELAAELENI